MRFHYKLLLSLLFILAAASVYINLLPQFFSWQNPIDPAHLTRDYDSSAQVAFFNNLPLSVPSEDFLKDSSQVMGDSTANPPANKRIEVDLTTQRLNAFENDQLVYSYLISSGTWGRTPTGTFKIWAKVLSHKMSGGSKELGTYYYLPNVPYIMFFYNDKIAKSQGFSIHGTYWHHNFGVPMSHGCINMRTPEAALMYNWADTNTPIIIFGKYTPNLSSKSINLPNANL